MAVPPGLRGSGATLRQGTGAARQYPEMHWSLVDMHVEPPRAEQERGCFRVVNKSSLLDGFPFCLRNFAAEELALSLGALKAAHRRRDAGAVADDT